ncbi:hypothetical protein LB566_03415 [Mesorhizobium sp. CA13]|uniref:hypothetical protein n=1 Tax=Mesorhizobium sp. CA13 TaxID=2876643 RepID=UPI001CC993D9|nr:hypothetical protein [Mesorhizobium sp. CA13]MBZ9852831.1 hypothetical protein [Mesorhizobium sp. CA13]
MNVGEFPAGMSAERRDLIETLEAFGYDAWPGVQKDWREFLSDNQLRVAIDNYAAQVVGAINATFQRSMPKLEADRWGFSAKLVDAMQEMLDASDAYDAADTPANEQRVFAALDRQKQLLEDIAKAPPGSQVEAAHA